MPVTWEGAFAVTGVQIGHMSAAQLGVFTDALSVAMSEIAGGGGGFPSGNYNRRNQLLRQAGNNTLRGIINQLYRPDASIGDGGTADMLRHEFDTGQALEHLNKAQERIRQINRLLTEQVLAPSDRSLAYSLLNDLYHAIRHVGHIPWLY